MGSLYVASTEVTKTNINLILPIDFVSEFPYCRRIYEFQNYHKYI